MSYASLHKPAATPLSIFPVTTLSETGLDSLWVFDAQARGHSIEFDVIGGN
jgi:hypothetical protein